MPDLSTTESSVKLLRWLVQIGESVERGQVIAEVETDKATMELESVATGIVEKLCAEPDQMVEIGQVVALIQTS
jgi:pyruvate dehydrogenase E2 component (dihydrolipoamide acetyltransferase)